MTLTRSERVSNLDDAEFSQRIQNRVEIIGKFADVVQEAVSDGKLSQEEFPEIEAVLGVTAGAIFGVGPWQWPQTHQDLLSALSLPTQQFVKN